MTHIEILVLCFFFFLAGAGVGAFAISAQMHNVLSTAKAEFIALRVAAEAKITEAENVIRRVGKAL